MKVIRYIVALATMVFFSLGEFVGGISLHARPLLRDLDIRVVLTTQGDAHITETRRMEIDSEGTECYIVLGNLNGSTVGDLLDFAGIELKEGDTVVRGGPLRGESLDRYDRSITKGSVGLFIVEQGTIAPMEGHSPCIECGSCSAICPARLRPARRPFPAFLSSHWTTLPNSG